MLRNTFRLVATKIGQPQAVRKYTDSAIRKLISGNQTIKDATKFSSLANVKSISTSVPNLEKEKVEICFIKADGTKIKATGKEGDSLLDVVVNNHIDLEGFGACEGTLTCSTCHLIFSKADYDKLPEPPGDEELDMLDLAYELTDTSRLGCTIHLTKDMQGLEIRVPSTINDARS